MLFAKSLQLVIIVKKNYLVGFPGALESPLKSTRKSGHPKTETDPFLGPREPILRDRRLGFQIIWSPWGALKHRIFSDT